MRAIRAWLAAALAGALPATLGVLASYWWAGRDDEATYHGAYVPFGAPRRYVDYLPTTVSGPRTDWVSLLVPAAVAGALAGIAVWGVVAFVRRVRRSTG